MTDEIHANEIVLAPGEYRILNAAGEVLHSFSVISDGGMKMSDVVFPYAATKLEKVEAVAKCECGGDCQRCLKKCNCATCCHRR